MAPIVERKTVVVVDDDELCRAMMADALGALGYRVVPCRSAADALMAIHGSVPAACIVDHVMPNITGAQLIRVLRTSANPLVRSMPIIGISGSAPDEMTAAGATRCLQKPVSPAMVARGLRAVGVRPRA